MREWEGRMLANFKKGEQKYRLSELLDIDAGSIANVVK